MRLADMHIHTTFSPDGKSSMEEQCMHYGLTGCVITDSVKIRTFSRCSKMYSVKMAELCRRNRLTIT